MKIPVSFPPLGWTLVLLLGPLGLSSAEDLPATFDALRTHALEQNPGVHAREEAWSAARERVTSADRLPDPTLSITRFGESVQTRTGPQETILSVSQTLPWFGVRSARADQAAARSRVAEAGWWMSRRHLEQDFARAYYEWGYNRKSAALTREHLALLRKWQPVVVSRVEGGGELNMLLRLQVEIARLQDQAASLEREHIQWRARLGAMLNVSADHLPAKPEWDVPASTRQDETSLSVQVPELRAARDRIEASRAAERLADRAGYPDWMVGVNVIQTGEPDGGSALADAGRDPWNVMVGIRVPLWRGDLRADREAARADTRQAEWERLAVRNRLQADLTSARAAYDDAQRRLDLYGRELLDLAEQAAENSRTAYESGTTGLLEVIDSERTLLDLRLGLWRAAADAHIHQVTIETLTTNSEMK